jgi:hypothetical protein
MRVAGVPVRPDNMPVGLGALNGTKGRNRVAHPPHRGTMAAGVKEVRRCGHRCMPCCPRPPRAVAPGHARRGAGPRVDTASRPLRLWAGTPASPTPHLSEVFPSVQCARWVGDIQPAGRDEPSLINPDEQRGPDWPRWTQQVAGSTARRPEHEVLATEEGAAGTELTVGGRERSGPGDESEAPAKR